MPGLQKLAVARSWLAYRTPTEIHVRPVTQLGPDKTVERVRQPGSLGRPALGVDLVAFHRATATGSWITAVNVVSGKRLRLRYARDAQLLNPSLFAGQLLYVRSSRCSQQLVLGPLRSRRDRVLDQLGPLAWAGRRPRTSPHEPGRAPPLSAQAAGDVEDALHDAALAGADDRLRDRAQARPRRPHRADALAVARR